MTLNRREFVLTAAAVPFVQRSMAGSAPSPIGPGTLTFLAVVEDAANIAARTRGAGMGLLQVLALHRETIPFGCMLPDDPVALLGDLGSGSQARDIADRRALWLGFLIRKNARKHLADQSEDARLYRDAALLRELALDEHGTVRTDVTPAQVESLFDAIDRRLMIGVHTFKPDAQDPEQWITRLIDWDSANRRLYKRYAEIIAAPQPERMQRYITGPRFYTRRDKLLQLARASKHTHAFPASEVAQALDRSMAVSLYAAILRDSVHDILALPWATTR